MTVQHKNLTGTDLHEPKGAAAAGAGEIYLADGAASGSWTPLAEAVSNETAWDDFVVPLSMVAVNGPGGLTPPDWVATTSGLYLPGFDAAAVESVVFTVQLPHTYKAGTDLRPHIHWCPSTAAAGNVVWDLDYIKAPIGEVMDASATNLTITDATASTTEEHFIASFGTISGTNLAESDCLVFTLRREAGDGSDTYGADALGISVDIHFQVEKMGTPDELPT